MTIEKYIMPTLKEYFNNYFNDYELGLDITYSTLLNKEQVIFQLKTSPSQLSTIKGVIEKTTPIQVYFKCSTNNQQDVLDNINIIIDSLNNQIIKAENNTLQINLMFNTPSIIATQVEQIGIESDYISYGIFTLTAYATDLPLAPLDKYIVIDNVEYELRGVQLFQDDIVYTYGYSNTEKEYGDYKYQNKALTLNITLIKTNSPFCEYLMQNKYELENKIVDIQQKELNEIKQTIRAIILQITEVEALGVPTITIVLKGV